MITPSGTAAVAQTPPAAVVAENAPATSPAAAGTPDVEAAFKALGLTLIGNSVGNYGRGKACVMSAARAKYRLSLGLDLGPAEDELECACPIVRRLAIGLNDGPWWADDEERTAELTPLIDVVIGTRDDAATERRVYLVADRAVREFAPIGLEAAGLTEEAARLRALAPIVDKSTAAVACEAAYDAISPARARHDAAHAGDAAAAAWYAVRYTNASTYFPGTAADETVYAITSAAYAVKDAAARDALVKARQALRHLIDDVIAIKADPEPDAADDVIATDQAAS